jgi:hypothetical protein
MLVSDGLIWNQGTQQKRLESGGIKVHSSRHWDQVATAVEARIRWPDLGSKYWPVIMACDVLADKMNFLL